MEEDIKTALTIRFAPGCFDEFEGTQEELDTLVAQITEMVMSGELSSIVGLEADDEEFDQLPEEIKTKIASMAFDELREARLKRLH
jgi:hypothetical protein